MNTYAKQYRKDNLERIRQRERSERPGFGQNANDPVAMERYRAKRREEYRKKHPNAKTMEEYQASRSASKSPGNRLKQNHLPKIIVGESVMRICDTCGVQRNIEDFPRHGANGRKRTCKICLTPVKKPKAVAKRKEVELPRFMVSSEKKEPSQELKKFSRDERLKADGWIKLLSEADMVEWMSVYIRRGVILYIRGRMGTYSVAVASYGVMFDDSGKRHPTLGAAEKVAQRMRA